MVGLHAGSVTLYDPDGGTRLTFTEFSTEQHFDFVTITRGTSTEQGPDIIFRDSGDLSAALPVVTGGGF